MSHIYTVIGAKISTEDLLQTSLPSTAIANAGLLLVTDAHGSSYICTRSHSFEIDWDNGRMGNYGPLVVYQDSNWDKDKVHHFLEPLGLWSDGVFGVWVFAVM